MRDKPCLCFGRLNIVNMSILNKLINKFNKTHQNPSKFFCRHIQTYSKIYMERHRPWETQNNLEKVI